MGLLRTLLRCALSSLVGVAIEFGLLTALVSGLHLFYLAGAALSSGAYFVASFILHRSWAFRAPQALGPQLFRHGIVFGGGLLLGLPLLFVLVHGLRLPYQLGWALCGAISFCAWTFPMQRWFTFRPVAAPAVA